MAAATGQVLVPLGHKTGHDVIALPDLARAGFEQNRAVGLLQRFGKGNRRFIDAGASFGMQAFNGHAKGLHVIHQGVEKTAVVRHAQKRIAKHAGRERGWPHAFFVGPALRRLFEVKPFKLHTGHGRETHFVGTRQYAL